MFDSMVSAESRLRRGCRALAKLVAVAAAGFAWSGGSLRAEDGLPPFVVDGAAYAEFEDAFAAAQAGGGGDFTVISLQTNVVRAAPLVVAGVKGLVVFDLASFDITVNDETNKSPAIVVSGGGEDCFAVCDSVGGGVVSGSGNGSVACSGGVLIIGGMIDGEGLAGFADRLIFSDGGAGVISCGRFKCDGAFAYTDLLFEGSSVSATVDAEGFWTVTSRGDRPVSHTVSWTVSGGAAGEGLVSGAEYDEGTDLVFAASAGKVLSRVLIGGVESGDRSQYGGSGYTHRVLADAELEITFDVPGTVKLSGGAHATTSSGIPGWRGYPGQVVTITAAPESGYGYAADAIPAEWELAGDGTISRTITLVSGEQTVEVPDAGKVGFRVDGEAFFSEDQALSRMRYLALFGQRPVVTFEAAYTSEALLPGFTFAAGSTLKIDFQTGERTATGVLYAGDVRPGTFVTVEGGLILNGDVYAGSDGEPLTTVQAVQLLLASNVRVGVVGTGSSARGAAMLSFGTLYNEEEHAGFWSFIDLCPAGFVFSVDSLWEKRGAIFTNYPDVVETPVLEGAEVVGFRYTNAAVDEDWPDPETVDPATPASAVGLAGALSTVPLRSVSAWALGAGQVPYAERGTIIPQAFLLDCTNSSEAASAKALDFRFTAEDLDLALAGVDLKTINHVEHNGTFVLKAYADPACTQVVDPRRGDEDRLFFRAFLTFPSVPDGAP